MSIKFDQTFLLAMHQYRQAAHVQARFQRYLTLLHPLPGQRILDLGCGSGEFCRSLTAYVSPGGHITGVDHSVDAVTLATNLSIAIEPTLLTFELGDGHRLPYTDASFDAATCISVLAFCTEPVRVLTELGRVIRPSGRLLVANADEDTRFYNSQDRDLGRRIQRVIADRAYDAWAGRRLVGWLRSAGFTIGEELALAEVEHDFSPGAGGYTFAYALRDYVLTSGGIPNQEYERWLADLEMCSGQGAYSYGVTTFVYLAER